MSEETGKGIEEARAIAAQGWCQPKTSHKMMDSVIAEEFAKALLPFLRKAALCERMEKVLKRLWIYTEEDLEIVVTPGYREALEDAKKLISEFDREAKQ